MPKEANDIFIYKIENKITKKVYVGATKDFKLRYYSHKGCLNNNLHYNKELQNDWNKYKEGSFKFVILKECTKEDVIELETFYINKYPKDMLYNAEYKSKHSRHTKNKILKIDINTGVILKIYNSTFDAEKDLNIKQKTLNGSQRRNCMSAGYYWVYENDYKVWIKTYFYNSKFFSYYDIFGNLMGFYKTKQDNFKNYRSMSSKLIDIKFKIDCKDKIIVEINNCGDILNIYNKAVELVNVLNVTESRVSQIISKKEKYLKLKDYIVIYGESKIIKIRGIK